RGQAFGRRGKDARSDTVRTGPISWPAHRGPCAVDCASSECTTATATATSSRLSGVLGNVLPELLTGDGIHRVHAVWCTEVHDTINDHRRTREAPRTRMECPRTLQRRNVGRVDLRQ